MSSRYASRLALRNRYDSRHHSRYEIVTNRVTAGISARVTISWRLASLTTTMFNIGLNRAWTCVCKFERWIIITALFRTPAVPELFDINVTVDMERDHLHESIKVSLEVWCWQTPYTSPLSSQRILSRSQVAPRPKAPVSSIWQAQTQTQTQHKYKLQNTT